MIILTDLRFALRSLSRVKGLALTVIVTLALGIGANAAIFSVVRGVLLRPLANRDEDRLIYIRQSAQGIGADNAKFSVPEMQRPPGRRARRSARSATSRTIAFTMVGPRRAARGPRRRRRRLVLRRDGAASRCSAGCSTRPTTGRRPRASRC